MQDRYQTALTFPSYLASVRKNREFWHEIYRRAVVPSALLERARALPGRWRLLALSEDWCGDCVNTLPYLARLAEAVPNLELRVLSRDGNPDLMDAHLSNGSRAIPVVMILDEDFREVAWWGSRPAPLQDLFLREIKSLPRPERYPRLRSWYARDRGRTTVEEVIEKIPPPA